MWVVLKCAGGGGIVSGEYMIVSWDLGSGLVYRGSQ